MSEERTKDTKVERGSAMVISILVTAVMSLLGISYLLMADTENKIAENERLSAQCLYFGEGVVREVKRWFDRPPYVDSVPANGQRNLVVPTTALIDFSKRIIDTDGDANGDGGGTTDGGHAADGSATYPYYKGASTAMFDKPYRPLPYDMLLGTQAGPDMQIKYTTSATVATFLDGMATKIAPSFPASAAGLTARIDQIDIYEPPYLNIGGTWTRYGMATIKATVSIRKNSIMVAQRVVKAVLNETPYPGPYGPLQSCQSLAWNGNFKVHWGPVTAVGDIDPKGNTLPTGVPRAIPPNTRVDLLNFWKTPDDDANFTAMKNEIESGKAMDDPWWRLMANGVDHDYSGVMTQQIVAPTAPYDPDHSNMFHRMDPLVGCPSFDYQTWKDIAKSGGSDVHYYIWSTADTFQENGNGAATTYRALTDNKTGLFFFDTTNQNPPDGTNLTPAIALSGGTYGVQGFVYLNTSDYSTQGLNGRAIDMVWPGEPFRDSNEDGVYQSTEGWINLNYSTISTTDPTDTPRGSATDAFEGSVIRNTYGPHITGQTAAVWGVLYLQGTIDASGNAWYYGSVITNGGSSSSMTGSPDLWWDPRLIDNWPPPGWALPRVVISKWETDL